MICTTNNIMRFLLFQASVPARYWLRASIIAFRLQRVVHPHHTLIFFGTTPSYDILFLCVHATPTFLPLLISLLLVLLTASSSGTHMIIKGIDVLISPLIVS